MPNGGLIGLIQHLIDPDKAKREALISQIVQNPGTIQQLSNNVQSPEQLQALTGQAPRLGGNQDQQNLSSLILNTPQSPDIKAQSLQNFQDNGIGQIADAGVSNPQGMAAFRGMTPEQVRDQIQNASVDSTGKKQLLSQDQQDILSKKSGLDTSAEKQSRLLNDAETLQRTIGSKVNSDYQTALMARIPIENQKAQQEMQKNEQGFAADRTIDGHYQQNPKLKSKSLLDLWSDSSTPQDVKNAIPLSNKYGDSFKTQLQQSIEQQRLALEGQRIKDEKTLREEWLPKLIQANSIEATMKYGGATVDGFKDYFTGNKTPGAQDALNALMGSTPAQKIQQLNEYNSRISDIIKQDTAGKLKPDDAATLVQGANLQAQKLRGMGIQAKDITYAPAKRQGLGQSIEDKLGSIIGAQPHRTIQTVDGDTPTPLSYNQKTDPGKMINTVKDLQAKADLFTQLQKANPGLPTSALQARVEAMYNNKTKP